MVPSPKSQAYDATVPGAVSVDPDASTVQVACGQLTVNDATGATLGSELGSGRSTTVHIVALPEAALAVAVTRADAPTGEGAFGSEAMEVIRPGPVPSERLRCVWPAGRVQPVVAEDLSAQYETTYEPAVATLAPGVVCVVRLVGSAAEAKVAIGLSVA